MADPIEPKFLEGMNVLAATLEDYFNPTGTREVGFMVLVFDFADTSRVNYISNAERKDMITAMKEFIARAEGRMVNEPGHG